MKFWTKNGNEYVLNAPSAATTGLILTIVFAGLAVLVKVMNFHNIAFGFFAFFSVIGLLGYFKRKNQRITINISDKTFNTPKGGILGAENSFPLANFSHFQVNKVTYALIPIAVELLVYFFNDKGEQVKVQLGQKIYTNNTVWAQEIIDETEQIINQNKM